MIPNFVHADCQSSAEAKLFSRLKDELSDKFTILHSLSLSKHQRKLTAEIDFVIISEKGILCVEVKGGRVSCQQGIWYFTDKYHQPHSKAESPFDQARSAMYALRRSIQSHFGKDPLFSSCIFGYSVIFPDIIFKIESPEWDLNRVVDNSSLKDSLELLINRQYEYSAFEIKRVSTSPIAILNNNQIKELIQYLRGDFCFVPAFHQAIDESYQKVIRLTEEQYDLLDQLEENPRIRIKGGAGTGKTLLALEEARRYARNGKEVLFLCFNKFLSMQLEESLKNENYLKNITVSTFHSYVLSIIREAGSFAGNEISFTDDFFNKIDIEEFAEAFITNKKGKQFDCLIIDEGQDLGYQNYLQVLDWVLKGGLKKGHWVWFEDDEQDIYQKSNETRADFHGVEYSVFRLTKNCRNAKPIAYFTSLSTGTKLLNTLVHDGPVTEWICYDNESQQMSALCSLLNKLITGGVKAEEIMILSPCIYERSILRNLTSICNILIRKFDGIHRIKGFLHHSTIHSFKGLESKVVLVTDISDFEDVKSRMLNYVGFSRANSFLGVLSNSITKEQISRMAENFAFAIK